MIKKKSYILATETLIILSIGDNTNFTRFVDLLLVALHFQRTKNQEPHCVSLARWRVKGTPAAGPYALITYTHEGRRD